MFFGNYGLLWFLFSQLSYFVTFEYAKSRLLNM